MVYPFLSNLPPHLSLPMVGGDRDDQGGRGLEFAKGLWYVMLTGVCGPPNFLKIPRSSGDLSERRYRDVSSRYRGSVGMVVRRLDGGVGRGGWGWLPCCVFFRAL